ncbi:MAG: amino acid adenylation domain-containing protein [Gammaproteobacteria bacterium]|nr:amino acid adenylation domain-containing protein [Gammaproteobacteria bacterium]
MLNDIGQKTPKVDNIHKLIEYHALIAPELPAISCNGKLMTYKELNERSNQLAHLLIKRGVKNNTFIGIALKKSLEMIVSITAVLKAGGAFLPIDPDYPEERTYYMLNDSDTKHVITHYSLFKENLNPHIDQICLEFHQKEIISFSKENLDTNVYSNDLACLHYTSGSTGIPRGVMVSHHNLINAYHDWMAVYQLSPNDRHLQMANFTFDVFTGDFIRALCSGGKLVLCPKRTLLNPKKLYELLVEEKINCAEFVPTILRRLLSYAHSNQLSLGFMRLLICGSDNWSMHEYRETQKLCGKHTRVINSYGLTETTIDSTYFESSLTAPEQFNLDQTVPIGIPFPHTEIFLLDENLQPVINGGAGEIYIGGPSLAKGYLNNRLLTSEKFIEHPVFKKRLYKTGDIGLFAPDGNLNFLGRIDNQIKIRGIRIELSDIENALNRHPSIAENLVSVSLDENKEKILVAYVVLNEEFKLDAPTLRKFLQSKLPQHMIPSNFIKLEAIPITSSGKLNRKLLTA